jgi:hypothetical protein
MQKVTDQKILKAECVIAALREFLREIPHTARIRLFEMMREKLETAERKQHQQNAM